MEDRFDLEECSSGGWKAQFDPERWNDLADRIRDNVEPDVDTAHMLLWHMDDIKISFVKSSGVMTVRTEEKEQAASLIRTALDAD